MNDCGQLFDAGIETCKGIEAVQGLALEISSDLIQLDVRPRQYLPENRYGPIPLPPG